MPNYSKKGIHWNGGNEFDLESNGTILVKSGGVINYATGAVHQEGGVAMAVRKAVTVVLAGGTDTAGGIGSWVNPEAGNIWIERLTTSSQGTGGAVATAACNLDVGTTSSSATTLSDNLIDGMDIHSAVITGDNFTNPGANGKSGQLLASGKWVTFSTGDAGASAGFVGEAIIEYLVL